MVNQVNWDIAPSDATHHGHVNNKDHIAWYKQTQGENGVTQWAFWYSKDGILDLKGWTDIPNGQPPMQLPVTPRPVVKLERRPEDIKWSVGYDLPPIGLTVELSQKLTGADSRMFKWDAEKGAEVKIIEHIKGEMFGDYDVAVFLYKMPDGTTRVRQAVARVFKKVRTAEEKAAEAERLRKAEEQKKLDAQMTEIANKAGIRTLSFTEKNLMEKLHKAGLLK